MELAADLLMEWFDAVQLFGCWDTETDTEMRASGRGNMLARERHVERWLKAIDTPEEAPEDDED